MKFRLGPLYMEVSWNTDPLPLHEQPHLEFNYVSHATRPDEVQVFREGALVCTYKWIDGEAAHHSSSLGKLHARFDAQASR